MILQKLTIQNFLSIRSITLDLNDRGLVLIKGKNMDNEAIDNNGSGKSSLIEALVYALYGRTIRGLKGDAVVHNIPKKNMKIWLDLTDDNGDTYRIARYRKHSTNKNKSFLYKNGKDITPKSEADFNEYVADLLQADYLTFTSSLLYTAESFKFTSATDSEMKSTFDKMLGLDVFSKCLEITKNRLKEVEGDLSTTEWKIDDRKKKIDSLAEQISEAEELVQEHEDKQKEKSESLKKQLEDLEEELTEKQGDLLDLNEELEKAEENKDKAEKQLASKRKKLKEVDELKAAIQDIKDEISEHEREITKAKKMSEEDTENIEVYQKRIEKYQKKIEELQQKKDELDEEIGLPCPTCGQPMTAESIEPAKKEYDEQIQSQQDDIVKQEDKISKAQKEIEQFQKDIRNHESEIEELQADVEQFETLIKKSKKLIDEKAECEEKVQEFTKKYYKAESAVKVKASEIKQTEKSIEQTKKDIDKLSKEENPYFKMIDKYKEEQSKCTEEISELEEGIQDKLDEKQCLQFWQQAYSNQGIKSLILDDITPFLNRRVNKYLNKLAAGHIEVKFNTQTTLKSGEVREKFSIEINNQDGGSEYIANSAGEKKRVDLSINLALQDLVAARSNKSLNISIFDEIFDALDESGIESVIELLQELSQEKSSIFVISHNPHLQSMFSNTITVVKKDGFSTILEGCDESEDEEE